MPRGPRYYVYTDLTVHNTSSDALSGASPGSTLRDNYNTVEGSGTPYIDNFSGYESYHPAVPIWWVPSFGESGYSIGWINDSDNGFPLTVGDSSGWINDSDNGFPLTVGDSSGVPRRAKAVWVGDSSGVPRKAKAIWVGDSGGTPRKGR